MKKILFLLFCLGAFIIHPSVSLSQCNNWQPLGPNDSNQATTASTNYTSITTDTAGNPYIIYQDASYNNHITVRRYKNGKWEGVGAPGFSYGVGEYPSIAISKQDTVFVAYIDDNAFYRETVMKFNGTKWVSLGGSQQISAGAAKYASIVIDSTGNPYVAYEDVKDSQKATVMKYTYALGWANIGKQGFSDGAVDRPSIALDKYSTPYVVYIDNVNGYGATVMKFNGTNWVPLGTKNFTGNPLNYPVIAVAPDDTVFVAYSDNSKSQACAMKFNGTSWVFAGRSFFSAPSVTWLSLAIDSSNVPYVTFQDYYAGQKATVMKLVDTSWTLVGARGFSPGAVSDNSIAISPSGIPYLFFAPGLVMKYNNSNWERVGDIGTYEYTTHINVAIDTAGNIYMGGNSFSHFTTVGVVKYVDTGWVELGHPLGNGISSSMALDPSGVPYILCSDNSTLQAIVMKYQDTSWTYVGRPKFSTGEIYYSTIAVDRHGTPYIGFADNANGDKALVMKFIDTSWVPVGAPDFTSNAANGMVMALDTTGQPYIVYQNGTTNSATVMTYNGTSWVNFGTISSAFGIPDYASLIFDNTNTAYLAIESHYYQQAYVFKYTSGAWHLIGSNASPGVASYCSLAVDSAGTPYLAYEDGANNNTATAVKFNGSSWVPINKPGLSQWQSIWTSLAVDPFGSLIIGYQSTWAFAKKYGCGIAADTLTIKGHVYVDKNSDCIYDSGDLPLSGITVKALHNNKIIDVALTDTNGVYIFKSMANGYHYKIEIDSSSLHGYSVTSCISGSAIATVAPSLGNDFPVKCNNGFDLASCLSVCIDTPSYSSASIAACIYNNRCQPVNSTMKLIIDTAIHITSVLADTTATIIGDTMIWHFNNVGQAKCVTLAGKVDSLSSSDSVFVTLIADPIIGDSVPSNNKVTYWVKASPHNCIGMPYDPNQKSVYPTGTILPSQKLTYTIHFQNTGTSPAKNVVVMDTLSSYLAPTTLNIISSSSPVTTQLISGHIIRFTFANINLPDTAMSKTNSVGIVQYSITPNISASPGKVIANSAGIYFDSNPVILTNTTKNIIGGVITSIENNPLIPNIACFPNPFSNTTSLVFSSGGKHYLEVDDVTGRQISRIECDGNQYEFSKNNLTTGVYFIRSYNEGENYVTTIKVIVQ